MKILLDENLPRKLKYAFPEQIIVATVSEMGWSGKNNGELLDLAESMFDVFITVDKNIRHQQNFTHRQLILVVLIVIHNKMSNLLPLIPKVLKVLQTVRPGEMVNIR